MLVQFWHWWLWGIHPFRSNHLFLLQLLPASLCRSSLPTGFHVCSKRVSLDSCTVAVRAIYRHWAITYCAVGQITPTHPKPGQKHSCTVFFFIWFYLTTGLKGKIYPIWFETTVKWRNHTIQKSKWFRLKNIPIKSYLCLTFI